jgi:hypothetical protein
MAALPYHSGVANQPSFIPVPVTHPGSDSRYVTTHFCLREGKRALQGHVAGKFRARPSSESKLNEQKQMHKTETAWAIIAKGMGGQREREREREEVGGNISEGKIGPGGTHHSFVKGCN